MKKLIKTEILKIGRLKKDGTIEQEIADSVVEVLKSGGAVFMPVDCMYGLLASPENMEKIRSEKNINSEQPEEPVLLISSFKMADCEAEIGKHEFDFLHRIWPGEVNIFMKKKKDSSQIVMRMPRSRYILDLLNKIGMPVTFLPAACVKKRLFRENEIIKQFTGTADMILIIKEFCKDHIPPSVCDISGGSLKIIREGRVQAEDIKSLYFLDGQAN